MDTTPTQQQDIAKKITQVCMTESEQIQVKQWAKEAGLTVSNFMRVAIGLHKLERGSHFKTNNPRKKK